MDSRSEVGKWAKVGVDGFVLAPPPRSLGSLLLASVVVFAAWGLLAWFWEPGGLYANPGHIVAGLVTLLLLGSGVRNAAVRTTLTVRGGMLRIERTWFGLLTRTYEVRLSHVTVIPGKRRERHGSWYVWFDLRTPHGTFRVALGSFGAARAEATLNETLQLLQDAKSASIRLPGEDDAPLDPEARKRLDALRGRRAE